MGLGGFLKGLLGGGGAAGTEPAKGEAESYKDFTITPTPLAQGGQFLTSGIIAKDFPTGRREHKFIRADTHASAADAASFALQKGRQIIDEQGDRLFGPG